MTLWGHGAFNLVVRGVDVGGDFRHMAKRGYGGSISDGRCLGEQFSLDLGSRHTLLYSAMGCLGLRWLPKAATCSVCDLASAATHRPVTVREILAQEGQVVLGNAPGVRNNYTLLGTDDQPMS